MQRHLSVFRGLALSMAFVEQILTHFRQEMQAELPDGLIGKAETLRYDLLPLTVTEVISPFSFSKHLRAKSRIRFISFPSGRSLATSGKIECHATKAAAPTTTKPCSVKISVSSRSASS